MQQHKQVLKLGVSAGASSRHSIAVAVRTELHFAMRRVMRNMWCSIALKTALQTCRKLQVKFCNYSGSIYHHRTLLCGNVISELAVKLSLKAKTVIGHSRHCIDSQRSNVYIVIRFFFVQSGRKDCCSVIVYLIGNIILYEFVISTVTKYCELWRWCHIVCCLQILADSNQFIFFSVVNSYDSFYWLFLHHVTTYWLVISKIFYLLALFQVNMLLPYNSDEMVDWHYWLFKLLLFIDWGYSCWYCSQYCFLLINCCWFVLQVSFPLP